jgi:transcriptional regulator with XRE-family HTH domain
MNDFVVFLEEVKKKHNLRFDSDLAEFLGLSKKNIGRLMQGRGIPSDETCVKIALAIGEDPLRVIGIARKTAAADQMTGMVWDRLLKTLPVFFYVAGGWSMAKGVTDWIGAIYIM